MRQSATSTTELVQCHVLRCRVAGTVWFNKKPRAQHFQLLHISVCNTKRDFSPPFVEPLRRFLLTVKAKRARSMSSKLVPAGSIRSEGWLNNKTGFLTVSQTDLKQGKSECLKKLRKESIDVCFQTSTTLFTVLANPSPWPPYCVSLFRKKLGLLFTRTMACSFTTLPYSRF